MAEYGKVFGSLKANVDYINAVLPIKESFDLIQRDIIIGERQSTFYFIDGFTKDETMQKLMSAFFAIKKDDMPSTATGFSKMAVSYVEVDGDVAANVDAFESIIRTMKEAGIGYGAVNHPVDRDPVCGYVGVINDVCPRCGRKEFEGVPMEKITAPECCGR